MLIVVEHEALLNSIKRLTDELDVLRFAICIQICVLEHRFLVFVQLYKL